MRDSTKLALGDIMAGRLGSVDPSRFPHEEFDLYSIPAYDALTPEIAFGSDIGSTKQIVAPNDVLLSKIVPHIRRAWIVGKDRGRRLIASGEWIVFRSNKVAPEYLRHLLRDDIFHVQFMKTVSGVGGSLLRARPVQVAQIQISLPPLAEQRRIAAILDKADGLRAKRREVLSFLESLSKSLFTESFGTGRGRSNHVLPLRDLVLDFRYGTSNKSGGEGYPALRIPNVVDGSLNLEDLKTVKVDEREFDRLKLQEGDVLFVRTNGNQAYIGRSAIFRKRKVELHGFNASAFIYASYLIRARIRKDILLPEVLQYYLGTPDGHRQLMAASKTSAGQFNINTEALGDLLVPVPPLDEQKAFASRLEAIDRIRATQRSCLDRLNTLFSSLQHRAFTGTL